jgi:pyruvate dehydrogenase E2 component (dihydrolipoamide acetyltransferase)
MLSEFRMPSLGPDMEAGTLVEWRVKAGDVVKRGDVIALIETDKGIIDVEVFTAGVVEKLLVEPDTHVAVGTVLALLSGAGEETPVSAAAPVLPPIASRVPESTAPVSTPPAVIASPADARSAHRKVSPAARTRARALGVDLSSVTGTGTGGVITLEDVLKHAPSTAAPPVAARVAPAVEQHDMRRVIARAMSRSKREIPHYYLAASCCFLAARTWLDAHNAAAPIDQRLLPSALFLKAVALAAREQPGFNGFYTGEQFTPASEVNVGMAIAMRGGRLVAPAILDADRKSLTAVMAELRDLTTRVRSGHMRGSELALPTITVTSLAEEGVDLIVPAIYPPQVAIVGFGSIVERPWVVEGVVRPAPLVSISLAADHRVSDGRAGARFLSRVRNHLESPSTL